MLSLRIFWDGVHGNNIITVDIVNAHISMQNRGKVWTLLRP